MRIWMLAAGAAALAIAAPALADPKGGGHGGGKGHSAQPQRGGGKAQFAQGDRHGGQNQIKGGRDRGIAAKQAGAEDRSNRGRGRGDDDRALRADRGRDDTHARRAEKLGRRDVRVVDNDVLVRRAFDRELFPGHGRGLIAGCPPGLDKKDNGCLPPGQAKKLIGTAIARTAFANSLLPANIRPWFRDNGDFLFRAGDGFIYRVDRDDGLIDGIIPLAMGGYGSYYALGDAWPGAYNFYNVPYQYQSFWPDNGDDCYRYDGFGAIYRVDCDTNVVNSIVSLLAGDLGVGSRLPMAYNVYNVPLGFRDTYFDTSNAWYRYNDGYIYRVDPTTRLITAVIDALV